MRRRPKSSRYLLAVIANDFQIPFHDEKALFLFQGFLRRERPDWLILNGDFQDFWEISQYDHAPRSGKEFKREVELGKQILRSFRRTLPQARITWIEGNHEFRLRKYLIQKAKELYGLHGLSVPDIFDLKRLKIEYVPCHELATKFTDNFIRVGDLYVGHWDKVSKHAAYAAKLLVEEKGVSLLQGHTQRFGVHARTTVDGRVLVGIENFSMCSRTQSYVSHANWQLGFSVIYVQLNTGRFHWFPILIGRGYRFLWRAREYSLKGTTRIQRRFSLGKLYEDFMPHLTEWGFHVLSGCHRLCEPLIFYYRLRVDVAASGNSARLQARLVSLYPVGKDRNRPQSRPFHGSPQTRKLSADLP